MDQERKAFSFSSRNFFGGSDLEYTHSFQYWEYSIDLHSHDFYELAIVLDGEGSHMLESSECSARRGCVFAIPPNVRHGFSTEKGLRLHNLLLLPSFFAHYAEELSVMKGALLLFEIAPQLRLAQRATVLYTLNEQQMQTLEAALIQCELAHASQYSGRETMKNATALLLIGTLCEMLHPVGSHENVNLEMLPVMEYIKRHCHEEITVERLCRRFHLSRTLLYRHFYHLADCTPGEYLLECRIRRARQLLTNTQNSITDIALTCGFYDSSHFIRKFIAATGITPGQYRRESRQSEGS